MKKTIFGNGFSSKIFLGSTLFIAGVSFGGEQRFFIPEPGYIRADSLPGGMSGRVDTLVVERKDAFDGAETHSEAERTVYDMGNALHIKTMDWAIRRRLGLNRGDSVTIDVLRELQRNLRSEEFLADAIVEVKRNPDSTISIKATTWDQWTLTPATSINIKDGEFVYWLGIIESNLLGHGQKLGYIVGHDLERNSQLVDYSNLAFTDYRLRLMGRYSWLSDGSSFEFGLSRPLLTRLDNWGFDLGTSGQEVSEQLFASRNEREFFLEKGLVNPKTDPDAFLSDRLRLGYWGRVGTYRSNASFTRAFGYTTRLAISPGYERKDRFVKEGFRQSSNSVQSLIGNPESVMPGRIRHDELLGVSASLYRYDYKTVHNFRNLKWSESLRTGWTLSSGVYGQQTWLGADREGAYFTHQAAFNDAFIDRVFFATGGTIRYFVEGQGLRDGDINASGEAQYKPFPLIATALSASWNSLFASHDLTQFTLGDDNGLLGFPAYAQAGKARFLATIEQRIFPPFEIGTLVPAFAVFLNGGNVFPTYESFDPSDLKYSVGIGLRVGATRSVQKVINHLNLAWPIGEKGLSGPVIGLIAQKNL